MKKEDQTDAGKSNENETPGDKECENTEKSKELIAPFQSDKDHESDEKSAENHTDEKPEEDVNSEPQNNESHIQEISNVPDNSNDDDGGEDDDSHKNRHPRLKAFIYTFCIIIVSALLAFFILFSVTDYVGMFRADKNTEVKITKGESIGQISRALKYKGIIRSAFVFGMYMKVANKTICSSGTFSLNSQMSYDAILRTLKSSKKDTVKVTIPEGYTLREIGEKLEKKKVCTKQQFLNAVEKKDVRFDFSSSIPENKDRFYRLEGYLFPDTYEFYVGQSPSSVVQKMLNDFDTRFDDKFRKAAKSSGMTVDQIITLASIIQVESSDTSEMDKVSSVFHNRLKNGVSGKKLLQSDATIFYATRDIKPILTKNSTEISSAYNTYKHEGLPPGPICNPGLAAIDAAINPEKTDYYYFVTDKDGNYYFASSYKAHLKNVKKATSTGEAGGTDVTK